MATLADSIRQFCSARKLKINTDLGQHFLIDESVLDAIIASAHIQPGEKIVEIGAGLGILTKVLLEEKAKVQAIEIDTTLIPLLKEYVGPEHMDHLQIIHQNALQTPFPTTPYKIVANIPYHITSPLLRHAFLEQQPPTSLTLLIQRDVAEKITDKKDGNLLQLIVSLFGKPHIVTHVPPEAFLPPPKVQSSVLHIESHAAPIASREVIDEVMRLAKHAFSQRRKMLRNTLAQLPDGMERMKQAGIEETRRPQTLTRDEWIALAG